MLRLPVSQLLIGILLLMSCAPQRRGYFLPFARASDTLHAVKETPRLDCGAATLLADTLKYGPARVLTVLEAAGDTANYTLWYSRNDTLLQWVQGSFRREPLQSLEVHAREVGGSVSLSYSQDSVRGLRIRADSVNDTLQIAQPIPPGTLERRLLFAVVPLMCLARHHAYALQVFDSGTLRLVTVRVAVTDSLRVLIGAREYDAYQVVIMGDLFLLPTTLYVTPSAPHRTLWRAQPFDGALRNTLTR